ncbi:hypothetical protein N7530_012806 [Penicillium desertorum]|uniref:Uncharacterized protein n=1 Tax=Penicillium desertorum TaxID=1303715 RepID=A0A9W9WD22_9EURO|nr:hypothetical protein N7530_012806 [Penicillium desertorum]
MSLRPVAGLLHRPPGGGLLESPPPPSKAEGAPPCGAPRASRLARRLRLPSTSPALHPARRRGHFPAAPTGAPRPLPRAASTAGRPSRARGGGPPVAHWSPAGPRVPGGRTR